MLHNFGAKNPYTIYKDKIHSIKTKTLRFAQIWRRRNTMNKKRFHAVKASFTQ